jgi:hypothetical protein
VEVGRGRGRLVLLSTCGGRERGALTDDFAFLHSLVSREALVDFSFFRNKKACNDCDESKRAGQEDVGRQMFSFCFPFVLLLWTFHILPNYHRSLASAAGQYSLLNENRTTIPRNLSDAVKPTHLISLRYSEVKSHWEF